MLFNNIHHDTVIKSQFLSAKTENLNQKLAKSVKAKISMPPSFSNIKQQILLMDFLVELSLDLPHQFAMRYMQDTWL